MASSHPPPLTVDDPHRLATAPVVVGVDGSESALRAVRWAADVAARRNRELLVVYGMNLDTASAVAAGCELVLPKRVEEVHHRGAGAVVAARELAMRSDPALRICTEVSVESAARLLIGHSARANLVVLGGSGMNPGMGYRTSTLEAVVRHADGRLVVVRGAVESRTGEEGPVVVGVDGSPRGGAAVAAAFEEAAQRRADLVAVHVRSDVSRAGTRVAPLAAAVEQEQFEVLAERLAGWQERFRDVSVTRKIYPVGPTEHLMEWSRSARLIVVGARGRAGFSRLLFGSTANYLVRHAQCPVMVAR